MIIYSVLPRLWGNRHRRNLVVNGTLAQNGSGKMEHFDTSTLDYIRSLGCTHIWYVGLLEHATTTAFDGIAPDPNEIVKGRAGSPYAIRDYYDIAPSLASDVSARMSEFEALVARTHDAGMGVLMDFIPNHVARTYASDTAPKGVLDLGAGDDTSKHFSPDNCFYYYPDQSLHLPIGGSYQELPARATGNDCFSPYPSPNDWYETVKLNYGVDYTGDGQLHADPIPKTWHRMLDILRFWADKGVDGFRCDMAEMVPEAFWAWAIAQLRQVYPQLIFLAEIYQPHRYRGYLDAGFDYLYDKVGVYDTVRAIAMGRESTSSFDAVRDAVGGMQASMCYFLENHDEQRLASDFFARNAQVGRPAMAATALSGTNPFLLYFAQELGERGMDTEGFSGCDGRTTIFDYWRLDTLTRLGKDCKASKLTPQERDLLTFYRQVLNLCHQIPALSRGQYHGLNYLQQGTGRYDTHRVLSFLRYLDGEVILVVANFAPEGRCIDLHLSEQVLSITGIKANSPIRETNLMTSATRIRTLTPLAPLPLELAPHDICLLRWQQIE